MLRFPRAVITAFGMVVACSLMPTACGRVEGQGRRLDLSNGRGVTVFFVLGFLDEYLGRHIVEGDDLVEVLNCSEAAKVSVFRRQLERLANEQGLTTAIRQETVQECLTMLRSAVLADNLNALYRKREAPPVDQSWTTDASGRRRRLETVWVDEQVFLGVERDLKFAYVTGAYARHGAGDSLRFANSQHKVSLLVDLLKELGCSSIRTESTQGFIPQTNTIYFQPSAELRKWLDRAW
jgi:hypothetical protein